MNGTDPGKGYWPVSRLLKLYCWPISTAARSTPKLQQTDMPGSGESNWYWYSTRRFEGPPRVKNSSAELILHTPSGLGSNRGRSTCYPKNSGRWQLKAYISAKIMRFCEILNALPAAAYRSIIR